MYRPYGFPTICYIIPTDYTIAIVVNTMFDYLYWDFNETRYNHGYEKYS